MIGISSIFHSICWHKKVSGRLQTVMGTCRSTSHAMAKLTYISIFESWWNQLEPVLLSALLLALHLVLLSALQSPKDLKLYTTNNTPFGVQHCNANSTPFSTPFGTAFSTPFSTRDLHINEVSSAKWSANLNNWRTPNGTPNGTVFSTPKDLKLNTTNNTPLECSTTNSTPTNGVLFGVLHSLASFDTRNNTRNSTNMSTASP